MSHAGPAKAVACAILEQVQAHEGSESDDESVSFQLHRPPTPPTPPRRRPAKEKEEEIEEEEFCGECGEYDCVCKQRESDYWVTCQYCGDVGCYLQTYMQEVVEQTHDWVER